jgi:hypothetical protein
MKFDHVRLPPFPEIKVLSKAKGATTVLTCLPSPATGYRVIINGTQAPVRVDKPKRWQSRPPNRR